jgi:putative oxidoreductase
MIRAGEWVPVMAVRVLIGMFSCISGGTKLFVKTPFGVFEQTMIESHILATSLCAAMLVGDRIVAIATNRIYSIQATGGLAGLDDFLYVPEVLYTLILLWLIFSGSGRYSFDGLIASSFGPFGVGR